MSNELVKQTKVPFCYNTQKDLVEYLDKAEPVVPSNFFVPNVINIFTDSTKPDAYSSATISHCITQTSGISTASILADAKKVKCNNNNEAEIISIVYALINYNNLNYYNIARVNIFTDSLGAVSKIRQHFAAMNYMKSQEDIQLYLDGINRLKQLSDYIWLMCAERARIPAPVDVYHIKAHTNDMGYVRTKFFDVNKESITINDAIKLANYNCFVDSNVNKSSRCF